MTGASITVRTRIRAKNPDTGDPIDSEWEASVTGLHAVGTQTVKEYTNALMECLRSDMEDT